MLKLSLRSLRARKLRYLLASTAVILGVTFVVGSLVVTDTLRNVFDDLSRHITQGVDVQVRSKDPFARKGSIDNQLPPVPDTLLPLVRAVPGVKAASGDVQAFLTVIAPDGSLVKAGGAPVFAFNWDGPERSVGSFNLASGKAPGAETVAVDVSTAKKYNLRIGDRIIVRAGADSRPFVVSGTVKLGDRESSGAASFLFDTPTAQSLSDAPATFHTISAAADLGIGQDELARRIGAALPAGYEAVTGAQVAHEFSSSFSTFITAFRWVLLAFGIVALLVSTFLISNTFNIVLGQRVRELGVLRAIGAHRRQIVGAVLIESLLIGLFGSIVGAVAGVGVGALLRWLIETLGGGSLPGPLVILGRTWVVAVVVGTVVTACSSVIPAWRAGRISPVTAMRDGASAPSGTLAFAVRVAVGALCLLGGSVLLGFALFGGLTSGAGMVVMTGAGALLVFVGVALLSVVVARPFTLVLGLPPFAVGVLLLGVVSGLGGVALVVATVASGSPVAIVAGVVGAAALGLLAKLLIDTGLGGVTLIGRLARENAARNPRRSTSTAAALMIGLALVAMASVVGQSLKATISKQIDTQLPADYFFTVSNQQGMSPEFGKQLGAMPEVGEVAMVRQGVMRVNGESKRISALPATTSDKVLKLKFLSGGMNGLQQNGVLVQKNPAHDLGLHVGDKVTADFVQTGRVQLTVVGIFDQSVGGFGNWVISTDTFTANFASTEQRDLFGAAVRAPGVDRATAQRAIERLAERYPEVQFADRSAFRASQQAQVDRPLISINVLLVFSLLNALFGIANTMALSVIERTREIGLLRAVGMGRQQVRRMIRWESIIVATFGAALGVVLGVIFGVALANAMPKSIVTTVAVPLPVIAEIGILAVLFGLFAAMLPARRAARLNVLEAIATE